MVDVDADVDADVVARVVIISKILLSGLNFFFFPCVCLNVLATSRIASKIKSQSTDERLNEKRPFNPEQADGRKKRGNGETKKGRREKEVI